MLCSIPSRSFFVRSATVAAALLVSVTTSAADDAAKKELQDAAEALAQKDNYSWTSVSTVSRGDNMFDFESRGMIEKDGLAHVTVPRDNNSLEFVAKAGKGAVKTEQGWRSLTELESDSQNQGRRFVGRMVQNFKAPAAEAADLIQKAKEVKKEGDGYTAQLSEEGAKELLTFGRGRGGEAPQVSNAKGTVRFTITDGVLSKYVYEVEGTVRVEGNEATVERQTDVQIRDVGTTKLNVPEEAKSKAS